MKRLPALILSLTLLLALTACKPEAITPTPSNTPSPAPSETVSPSPSSEPDRTPPVALAPSSSPEMTQTPEPEPSVVTAPEHSRYFFLDGFFLGAWCDGTWYSAHETDFTLGQLFNRPYSDCFNGSVSSVYFYVGEGPGGYENFSELSALLAPFGSIENEDLILDLPAQLSGDAAALPAPDYSFSARFENTSHPLVSNAEINALRLSESTTPMADDLALQLLADAGVSCDLDRVWRDCWLVDYDSDGETERLELIRNRETDSGYANLEEGDPIFYAIFLIDGDETSLVVSCSLDHTTDLTAQFSLHNLMFLYDLNGDGVYEIYFQHRGWESGHCAVYTLTDDRWTEVLRAEYGT